MRILSFGMGINFYEKRIFFLKKRIKILQLLTLNLTLQGVDQDEFIL